MKCPKDDSHKHFVTVAHEMHDWLVDGDGNFIEDKGCVQVSFKPDEGNTWTCAICGTEAVKAE